MIGVLIKNFLIYSLKIISAKVKAMASPDGGKSSKVYYLYPDADTQIYNLYGSGTCTTGTCNTLILYLKHDNISNKRGKVIINRVSGRITSDIVNYP